MSAARVTAASLRRAFDERFAAPSEPRRRAVERLVLARAGDVRVALPLADVARVQRVAKIVHAPGGAPSLLGIAGVAGRALPIFDLAMLLGLDRGRASDDYVVVTATPEQVGLTIGGDVSYAEISPAEISASIDGSRPHVRSLARAEGALVPIVDVRSIVAELSRQAGGSA